MQFYSSYNAGDVDGVMSLMAHDCSYHDMIYSDPFDGHAEIRAYFEKVREGYRGISESCKPCIAMMAIQNSGPVCRQ